MTAQRRAGRAGPADADRGVGRLRQRRRSRRVHRQRIAAEIDRGGGGRLSLAALSQRRRRHVHGRRGVGRRHQRPVRQGGGGGRLRQRRRPGLVRLQRRPEPALPQRRRRPVHRRRPDAGRCRAGGPQLRCWFFDFDNDGWLDLFVTGYDAEVEDVAADYLGAFTTATRPSLYRNGGDGSSRT